MKHQKLLFILALLLFATACKESRKNRIARIVNEWQDKEVRFPSGLTFTRLLKDTVAGYELPQSRYKVFVYVDSIGCMSCKLKLGKWKEFIHELNAASPDSVPFVFVFHPKDLRDMYALLVTNHFDLPVCIDLEDRVNRLNQFPGEMSFQSFLLDKDNKVKIIGNPTYNDAVKKLYQEEVAGKNIAPAPKMKK